MGRGFDILFNNDGGDALHHHILDEGMTVHDRAADADKYTVRAGISGVIE